MRNILKRKIYAIHDRDLQDFLAELDLLEKVQHGRIKCPECECTITLENVGFISMFKGEVKVCCDKLECFYKMRREAKGVRKG